MIKAPPVAVEAEAALAAGQNAEEMARLKDEHALRRMIADADGRHVLKWLMDVTDLEGVSDSPIREGARRIGLAFKVYCESLGPEVYAGLVAEMAKDRVTAEALRAKAASSG